MGKKIEISEASSSEQLKQLFAIRNEVFVKEQNVSKEEEYDQFETSSKHLIAYMNSKPIGTCRFRSTDKGVKLERFAVLKEYRGRGVGEALVMECLRLLAGEQNIYLHAQIQVVDFYAKFGFEAEGEEFVEANIRHYRMVYSGS